MAIATTDTTAFRCRAGLAVIAEAVEATLALPLPPCCCCCIFAVASHPTAIFYAAVILTEDEELELTTAHVKYNWWQGDLASGHVVSRLQGFEPTRTEMRKCESCVTVSNVHDAYTFKNVAHNRIPKRSFFCYMHELTVWALGDRISCRYIDE